MYTGHLSKQNTVTLVLNTGEELDQQALSMRIGDINLSRTIILPIHPAYIIKNIFTGLKLIDLSKFKDKTGIADEILMESIINDLMQMAPRDVKITITKEHILILINGKTQMTLADGSRITLIGVLKMLFKLAAPFDKQKLREMYERAEYALLMA